MEAPPQGQAKFRVLCKEASREIDLFLGKPECVNGNFRQSFKKNFQAITNEPIIEKTYPTDPHPPPNLPLEGGENY
jgi:hypothetical protein